MIRNIFFNKYVITRKLIMFCYKKYMVIDNYLSSAVAECVYVCLFV